MTVSEPPQPPAVNLIGFDADYTGYWPASSSSNDLYIVRESTDGNNEGVTDFILVEQAGGSYSLNAKPSTAQISQFNTSTPAGIGYELADINLDGAMDLVLMNTSDEAVGFVYAATTSQSAPVAYKHIDAEFIEFFEDLILGLENPRYYAETARANNWGTWEYGDPVEDFHWTDELFLSGQLFRGVEPFYTDVSEAFEPARPFWCDNPYSNSSGYYDPVEGIWMVWGIYQELEAFHPDYSHWNQDAVTVANAFASYYDTETENTSTSSVIWQVLEEYVGVVLGGYARNESDAYNLVTLTRGWLFGEVVYQEPETPEFRTRVDLVYTDIDWVINGTPVLGLGFKHTWLLVTDKTGAQFATRAGPDEWNPPYDFGNIDPQALPPLDDDFRDNPMDKQAIFIQEVGFIDTEVSEIWAVNVTNILRLFRDNTNDANISYDPPTRNSNSYAFQAVERLGLPRPAPLLWAPGASTVLAVP